MDVTSAIKLVILVLFISHQVNSNECVGTSAFDCPQILSKHEYILSSNDNFTVFCQGNRPLTWTFPEIENKNETSFSTVEEVPTNNKFKYGLRLYISNITFHYVGFYYCHFQGADLQNSRESDSIYLYVNDSNHMAVSEDDYTYVSPVIQDEVAIIPCRPTSPDVEVKLLHLATDTEDEDYSCDPKIGCKLNVSDSDRENLYKCIYSRGEEEFQQFISFMLEQSSPVSHLAVPYLIEESGGHTIVGDSLQLSCIIKTHNRVKFDWKIPRGLQSGVIISDKDLYDSDRIIQNLTITNTTLKDNGVYTCIVSDYQGHENNVSEIIKIYDIGENYINISEPNDVYFVNTYAGKESIQWVVDVTGHPKPTVKWLDNRNIIIPPVIGDKYEVTFNQILNKASLKIKNIVIQDWGTYTLVGDNNKTHISRTFFLNVTDKPTVQLEVKPYNLLGTNEKAKCKAAAYPEPEFLWEYKPCQNGHCHFAEIPGNITKRDGLLFTSEIRIKVNQTGILRCIATNVNGSSKAESVFLVSDVQNGYDIFGFKDTVILDNKKHNATFAVGENIEMICGASTNKVSEIDWFYSQKIVKTDKRYNVEPNETKYSNRKKLIIHNATKVDEGLYSCRVLLKGNYEYKNVSVAVKSPELPRIIHTSMNQDPIEMNFPDRLELICRVFGIPKPTIIWEKDGIPFSPSEARIHVSDNKEKIVFNRTDPSDQGTYTCLAKNKMGTTSVQTSLRFKNLPGSAIWISLTIILLGALIGAFIYIIIKIRRERHLQRELEKLGLANFEKGAVENINPDLGIDDQAELLPYDKKWEFPIEQLKLGKQLGSGAFGVVMKGIAKNIVEGEHSTTVAVKMVKKNADNTYIRALASELKIMVHLGKHLNVVNLLGACTKNVAKRELLVIVEYCRFGNLQNYLLRHRDMFINQVDPKSGKIDYSIGQEYLDRSFSVSSSKSFKNPTTPLPNSMGDYRANGDSSNADSTDMASTTNGENVVMMSNNSIQPEWRSNYKGDYKGSSVKPISTKDLMAWSFQVSRGMDYLASRKVLHGDLAARNILLTDNNIVKICDFGLAKSMYKNDNYKKRGNCPLPMKWMAIESIRDRVFSTQSDVWSFGIVLWELFSLGRNPYPGMEADERLYHKLVEGYRMETPDYAPKALYEMMRECWESRPASRPTFEQLTERLGNLLEDSLRKHYIDLNDPYLVMNTKTFEENQNDYLAMVSPPTFEAQASPLYENDIMNADQGYMSMNKNSEIFSPRVPTENVFDFNTNNRKHLTTEDDLNATELLPMLHTQTESDSETPINSPNSISNPTYHQMPLLSEEVPTSNEIVKSKDNYVNMPQNKHIIKDKTNANNPFTNSSATKPEVLYVNSNSRDWDSVNI